MNKLLTKIVGVALGATMAVGVGVAAVKASDGGIQRADAATTTTSFTLSSADSASKDGVTVSFDKASGSTAPTWYAAGLRLYSKNTVTFTCANNITALSLNWEKQGSKAFITDVTSDVGTYTHPSSAGTGTWSGSATSIVLTLNGSGQLQLNTFSVTHESSGGDTPTDPAETIKEMDGKVWYIKAGSYYLGNDVSSSATASGVTAQSSAKKLLFTLASEDDTYYITDADDSTKYLNCTTTNGANVRLNTTKCAWVLTEKTLGDDTPGSYTLTHKTNSKILTCYESKPDWRIYNAGSTSNRNADLDFEEYVEPSETFTVSFDANGGTGSMSPVTDVYGNYQLPSCSFTFEGKEFAGWKANNSGDLIAVGDTYNVTEDVTFYAQWNNLYSVTYTAGANGTGSFVDSNKPVGAYSLLTFANLTGVSASSGYRFKNYTVGGVNKNPGESITLSANTAVTVNFEEKSLDTTYVFATNFATYAATWTNSYAEKTVSGDGDVGGDYAATINFKRVAKMDSGVGSTKPYVCPNTSSDVLNLVFTLTETGYKIGDVTVTYEQRGSNAPTFKLFKGASASGTALDSATLGTKDTLSATNLNDKSFSITGNANKSGNSGAGLTSIYISLVAESSFGTLDHIAVTSLPNKTIYHTGEHFASSGLTVTAYDNADESIASFKDVTALATIALDDGDEITDSLVPYADIDVEYTENGVTKETNS